MTFGDEIRRQIPVYLSDSNKELLVAELEAISRGNRVRFTLASHEDTFKSDMLQGDGWRGFVLREFANGSKRLIRGIVISNSCDVSPENRRDLPTKVTFAPLLKLAGYLSLLRAAGLPEDKIESKATAIRQQKVTSIFYLPNGGALDDEYIVPFDDIHSMPLEAMVSHEKLFTLNPTGFYMLVLKLSVHYCRLHENVNRSAATA
jgi:hypothetical protein